MSKPRHSQYIREWFFPVAVICAEDIPRSGLTNIPEILQIYTGMDVIRLDRNPYAMGLRGLHEKFK